MRRDDEVEVLVGGLPQHAVAQHARVRDEHVELAVLLHGRLDEPLGGLGGPDGGDDRDRAPTGLLDRRDGLVRGLGVDVVDDDGRTGRGERLGISLAEAASGARDDGDLALERPAHA